MPVFGLKDGERAWFAIIEDGQALANISAELAGKTDSFNKAYARFNLTPRTTIILYGVESTLDNRMVDAYAVEPYKGDISIRYHFLTGDEANYSGMANKYRDYLVERLSEDQSTACTSNGRADRWIPRSGARDGSSPGSHSPHDHLFSGC